LDVIADIAGPHYVGGISRIQIGQIPVPPLHISDWPICVVVTNTYKIR